MYEATALPIRIKSPWKSQYSFYQAYFPYTLVGCKNRNNRRSKNRNVAFICLMFFVSFFLLCYHYQNISLDASRIINDDLVDVSSSSSLSSSSGSLVSTPMSLSSKSQATFSLSTLLWPRKMFASKSQISGAGENDETLVRVMSEEEEEEEEKKKKKTKKLLKQREPSEPEEVEADESEGDRQSLSNAAAVAAAKEEEDEEEAKKHATKKVERKEETKKEKDDGVDEEEEVEEEKENGDSETTSELPVQFASNGPLTGGQSEKRLPQVIIIGVRKCGTRALLEFLNLHSRIQKARDEVHFFDEDTKYSQGLEWYRKQMPYSYVNQVTIEKTPAYFVTDSAPERIRAMNSSIRLILLVRDPVTRLISDYAQLNANKLAKKERPLRSIEQMVLLQDGSVNVNYRPVKTSIYSYYYTKWAEVSVSRQTGER